MARMISRQGAAELLDCTTQTISNWIEKGFIKGHTIGRVLMVDRDSIEQHFDTAKEVAHLEQSLIDRKRELKEELKKVDASLGEIKQSALVTQSDEWREVFRSIVIGAIKLGRGLLSDRECKILEGYVFNKPISELSKEMQLTPDRTRQVASRAIYKLSERMNLKELYAQNESLVAEVESLKKQVEDLGEIASKYESLQDLINSHSMRDQYEKECSKPVMLLKRRIEDLPLSTRTQRVLSNLNLHTLGDVVSQQEMDLSNVRSFGRKSLDELKRYITDLGFSFGMDVNRFLDADFKVWLERHQSKD
jgi:dynactin complex subunit